MVFIIEGRVVCLWRRKHTGSGGRLPKFHRFHSPVPYVSHSPLQAIATLDGLFYATGGPKQLEYANGPCVCSLLCRQLARLYVVYTPNERSESTCAPCMNIHKFDQDASYYIGSDMSLYVCLARPAHIASRINADFFLRP